MLLVLQMIPLYRLTGKSAIFGPILSVVLQMVHLYKLTGKSAIFGPTLSLVLQMVPLYRLTGEKCKFLPYFVSGAPNCQPYRLTGENCCWCFKWSLYTGGLGKSSIFCPILSVVLQMVPLYHIQANWGKVQFLHLFGGASNGPTYRLIIALSVQTMHLLCQCASNGPLRSTVLGNQFFYSRCDLYGPLPFAAPL